MQLQEKMNCYAKVHVETKLITAEIVYNNNNDRDDENDLTRFLTFKLLVNANLVHFMFQWCSSPAKQRPSDKQSFIRHPYSGAAVDIVCLQQCLYCPENTAQDAYVRLREYDMWNELCKMLCNKRTIENGSMLL